MGRFLKRARINLTTPAAIDREMSNRGAFWEVWAEDFHPQSVIKDAAKVLVLLKGSVPDGERVLITVCEEFRVCWAGQAQPEL